MGDDTERPSPTSVVSAFDTPLIAIFADVDGKDEVRYFSSLRDAEAAISDEAIQRALELCGAWSDMDWDELVADLDRIRHSSPPTPPINLDDIE